MVEFEKEHSRMCVDPKARNPSFTTLESIDQGSFWKIEQTVTDPDDHNDWGLEFLLDVDLSRHAHKPILTLLKWGPLT